jgi:hypothetical protein
MADLNVTYDVTVNTPSGINGTTGYIDIQFNPGMGSTLAATADVGNFSTDGMVGALVVQNGDATGPSMGPLTTTLSFDNGTSLNELTYAYTYGSTVSFDVTLMQSMAGGTSGSTFAFSLLDSDGNPEGTGTGGALVTITINPGLTTTLATGFPAGFGGSVTQRGVTAVPEPSTLFVGGLGIIALAGWSRLRRSPAA